MFFTTTYLYFHFWHELTMYFVIKEDGEKNVPKSFCWCFTSARVHQKMKQLQKLFSVENFYNSYIKLDSLIEKVEELEHTSDYQQKCMQQLAVMRTHL